MGGKTQQSSSSVSIPPEVLARYNSVNSQAQSVSQTPFQQYSNGPNAFVAPLTPTQQAGILGVNQYSNEAQPFYQSAADMTANAANSATAAGSPNYVSSNMGQYFNPYIGDVIAPTAQLMEQQFNQAQSQQLGNAIQQGAFGGDREPIVAANLQQQQGLAFGNEMGQLLNQNWAQALGAAQQQQQAALGSAGLVGNLGSQMGNLGAAAQASGLSGAEAQLAAGQAQQQTEQAGLSALYNQFLQQQSYPFQTAQFLANIAEGTGALSGSSTSATSPAPFFSDERLKEDIEPIGETYDGQRIFKFAYKGHPQKHIGLIAQEVERKHPEAVGLARGFRTVDYDAATRDAARAGRNSQGGEVIPFPMRRGYAGGGLTDFDPSFLGAQEESYQNAPWAGVGPVVGLIPYGGKSHVPPSAGGGHGQLAVAKLPAQQPSGIQQLAGTLKQVEGLADTGKGLFNTGKSALDKASGLVAPKAANPGDASASVAAPKPASLPIGNDASGGDAIAQYDVILPDAGDVTAARGGLLIARKRADGGSAQLDYGSDDETDSGSMPYKSGSGSKGLMIPDDRPVNKLATSNPPSSGSDSGLSDALGLAKVGLGIAGLFGLKGGGRVGLAGGGSPDDIADMPIPDLESGADPSWPKPKAGGLAIIPDAPANADQYRAQVVAPAGRGIPPVDYSSYPGEVVRPTVKVPDTTPGLAGAERAGRGWLGENQDIAVPAMRAIGRGLLTALSSNSRYGIVGLGQGLGAALDEFGDSYGNTQNALINRGRIGAGTVGELANAGQTQATTGNIQTHTVGTALENEAKRQALTHGDLFSFGGNDYVTVDDGNGRPRNVLAADWIRMGMPTTYHQAHTAAGNPPQPGKPNVTPIQMGPGPGPNGQPGQPGGRPQSFGAVGGGGMSQADTDFSTLVTNPQYRAAQKGISDGQEQHMFGAFQSAVAAKQLLNQSAENLARMPSTGVGAPGALNSLETAGAYRWNSLVDLFGGSPDLKVNPDSVASSFTQQKLQAMQDFARANGAAQHAFSALELANHATAGAAMDKDTISRVLASLYIDNQQDIDKWNYLQDYKKYIASKGGAPFANMYTVQGAMTGFANDHRLDRYGPEERQLESVLGAVDQNGVPIISRYQKGLSPKMIQTIEKKYNAPGLMQRYFGGGNG